MKRLQFLLLFLFANIAAKAQFYNGLQNEFGKNRVQYQNYDWQFLRFEKFDVYFYTKGTEFAHYVAESSARNLDEMESALDFTLDDRIEIIVYNKQTEFVQSNVGLGSTESNIGGTAKIIGSKMFVYYDEDHRNIDAQIRTGLATVLLKQWLYGGSWRDRIRSSTVLNLPDWYTNGLVNYLGRGWDNEIDNKTKDAVLNGKYKKFNNLNTADADIAGHSIWNYIAETYGKEVIPNLVYMSQVSRNIESGFIFVFGVSLKVFMKDWEAYYMNKYTQKSGKYTNLKFNTPKGIKKLKKAQLLTDLKISNDGNHIAYSTNENGRFKVYLYDVNTHKNKRIYKGGIKLNRINDYSFPLITWHPSSNRFAFVTEENGDVLLHYYLMDTKELENRPPLYYYKKILSIEYMPDGKRFLMSAVKSGQSDIFIYNIISNNIENITNDVYDDINPCVVMNGKKIVFASNRTTDSLKETLPYNREFSRKKYDLFMIETGSKPATLKQLSNTPYENEMQLQTYDTTHFTFLSDKTGSLNRYIAQVDSGLVYVDTVEHYNYFSSPQMLTNYYRNIEGQSFSVGAAKYAEWFLNNGRIKISVQNYFPNQKAIAKTDMPNAEIPETAAEANKYDFLKNLKQVEIYKEPIVETPKKAYAIDYNNYIFEDEKAMNPKPANIAKLDIPVATENQNNGVSSIANASTQGAKFKLPKQLNYFRYYTVDQVVTQFNNNFSNQVYQKFTGGQVYFTPTVNALIKIGLSDLFEDYRIVGGFRLSSDLKSNEFMLSYEDRHKRWDKQIMLYRQSLPSQGNNVLTSPKVLTHTLTYSLRYPISEVFSWRTSFAGRTDRSTFLSANDASLNKKTEYDYWGSTKTELIFDNIMPRMLNIMYGTRAKVFAEYFNQINDLKKNLGVLGIDVRHYQKLHKNLIWASRFAASSSFGSQRLIYYLGAVDNWTNLSRNPTFNTSVPIGNKDSYAFQTIATNMRGFNQNIRNGNNFAVLNNELRFPIFNYFYNRPLRSDFFNNFQLVGFYDVGSAWTGKSPFNADEEYNAQVIPTPKKGAISVTLVSSRKPIVYGYGWGMRSRLFGYFLRLDWANGIADGVRTPRIFYFSLGTDF